jgi:predicted unusual protein kinase regulating ubiquinone biosynthesis (AarF/ABC1/UbiB family)
MPSVVEADLKQLRLAMSIYQRMDSTLEHGDVYTELAERLREELDYLREAAQQRLYGLMLAGTPSVSVPRPIPGYCTRRLLTMTWLDGRALAQRLAEDPPLEERNAYAEALFRAWYLPFYRYGVIHGDPHLGNYQVRPDRQGINLLDFGTIRVFPASFVRGVILLYEAVRDHDDEKAAEAYNIWGFRNLSKETMGVLGLWAKFLYEPLVQDRVRPIQEVDDPAYGRKLAAKVHEGLKRTGGVRVPREFPLMDRAAVGLGSVFLRSRARLNWHRLFMEMIEGFDETALAERQAAALREAGVPGAASA